MIISTLRTKAGNHSVSGVCAKCELEVFESESLLNDAYNVWWGRCPGCGALNLLSLNHGLRGYGGGVMHLVLPTDEEVTANPGIPADTPTSGASGKPATLHGSVLGEISHQLMGGDREQEKT
jgi:hypothetical protein